MEIVVDIVVEYNNSYAFLSISIFYLFWIKQKKKVIDYSIYKN